MRAAHPGPTLAIDLSRMHAGTVTSFYSNLVTRPTGRAVRLGVETQLLELTPVAGPRLSILDFSQVRVMDYSCADEIVAKLLLRYVDLDRPVEAFFIARGLRDHHVEAIEAVLERHRLLLAAEDAGGQPHLLGPATAVERSCWSLVHRRRETTPAQLAGAAGLQISAVMPALERLVAARVALALAGQRICSLAILNHA